jgi:hypothetical protein
MNDKVKPNTVLFRVDKPIMEGGKLIPFTMSPGDHLVVAAPRFTFKDMEIDEDAPMTAVEVTIIESTPNPDGSTTLLVEVINENKS